MAVRRLGGAARARRILEFREELEQVVAEGAVAADDPGVRALHAHHDAVLAEIGAHVQVDLTRGEARLSAGMRLATLLGAVALSAAWGLLVASVWEDLGLTAQLLLAWLPPLLLAALVPYAARREPSGYLASIAASVAAIGLVVGGYATLDALDGPESRWPALVAGGYAMFVAYRHKLVLPLLLGVVGLGGWLWSLEAVARGASISESFRHAEPCILLGAAALLIANSRFATAPGFQKSWTILGMTALALPILFLGLGADGSWFGDSRMVEGLYQVIGLVSFAGLAWWGLSRDDLTLARGAAAALVGFLFFRLMDWFWNAIPKWLFFLLVGVFALGVLLVLQRIRARRQQAPLPS